MQTDLVAEIVRQVVIALFTVNLGMIGGVMRLHYRAWRKFPSGSGIIPLHVFVISLAQLCLLLGAAIGILDSLENPLTYKTYLYVSGSVLTLVALFIIGSFQRRRLAGAGRGRPGRHSGEGAG